MRAPKTISRIVILAILLLTLPLGAAARPQHPQAADAPVTTITVDSGTDPDNSKSKTCSAYTPCTLRRAIVEARLLAPAERPILIDFNIPAAAEEGYDSTLGVWIIDLMTGSDPSVFRYLDGGDITIDGSTQPGGRSSGPTIILKGPGTGNKNGLIVGSNDAGGHDNNTLRGLAFLNFKDHVTVNSNNNLISDCWFGLTPDGLEPFIRNGDAQDGSGSSGVALSAGASGNTITNNVFLGFDGVAAALRGDQNTFSANYVGTAASGKAPTKQTDPALVCSAVDWLGGGGVSVDGEQQTVEDNLFAGLRQQIFSASTQPDAVRVRGTGHLIAGNTMGLDSEGEAIGICGRGIFMSDSPKQVLLQGNTIVNPGLSAISLNGPLYDANELRGNVIRQDKAWPAVEGNPEPENAVQLGPLLPGGLRAFIPAHVSKIDGQQVSGAHGPGSPCPKCIIELFLDDLDSITEAKESLAVVTADGDGNWQATLPRALAPDEALRTTSTSAQFNIIPGLSAGTTSGLSALALEQEPPAFLPVVMGE
jgi:hypothetical protein